MKVEAPQGVDPLTAEPGGDGVGQVEVAKGGKAFVIFCARATQQFLTNNSMQMAAAVAFYSFFSLFPLSLLIILGFDLFISDAPVREEQLTRVLETFIPVSQDVLARTIDSVASSWGATGPLAFVGLTWAATAVFATLRKGINTAWNIWTPRPFLNERLIDLTVTAGAGLIFSLLLISTSVIHYFADEPKGLFGGPLWQSGVSLAVTFSAFTFLYWFLPNRVVPFRHVLFGAAIAALAFEIAKGFFFLYIRERAELNQVYGAFTSVAVLLGWLYISAAIVLIGALITAIYNRLTDLRVVSHADIWSFGLLPGMRRLRRLLLAQLKPDVQT